MGSLVLFSLSSSKDSRKMITQLHLKLFVIFAFLFFNLVSSGKSKKHGCEDISVSNCLDDDRYLLEEVTWLESNDLCQYYCRIVHNCLMFRFDGKSCRLLRKDTNKECSIIGGPPEVSYYDCLGPQQDKCETFIDEDCKYQGDVLIKPPPGTTSDGVECQEMCQEFKDIGCKYWVFLREEKSCTLYKSGKRKCLTKRGPYRPRFSRCKN